MLRGRARTDEVIDRLLEMQQHVNRYDGDPEADFNAEQNALVIKIDETEALHRLRIEPEEANPPEMYPWGV